MQKVGFGRGGSKYYSYNILTHPLENSMSINAVLFLFIFAVTEFNFQNHLYVFSGAILLHMLRMGLRRGGWGQIIITIIF